MQIYGLPPVVDSMSRTIILGTLPGTLSIEKQEYYADPNNQFWSILECVLGIKGLSCDNYDQKCKLILKKHIALWDILKCAERKGSTDNGFLRETILINDFSDFFKNHPHINKVLIAGTMAKNYYKKGLRDGIIPSDIPFLIVPSTSSTPGKYVLSFREKCGQWNKSLY